MMNREYLVGRRGRLGQSLLPPRTAAGVLSVAGGAGVDAADDDIDGGRQVEHLPCGGGLDDAASSSGVTGVSLPFIPPPGCGCIVLRRCEHPDAPRSPISAVLRAEEYEQIIVVRQRADGCEWIMMYAQDADSAPPEVSGLAAVSRWAMQKGFTTFNSRCQDACTGYGKEGWSDLAAALASGVPLEQATRQTGLNGTSKTKSKRVGG
jgi:hypothetical protein